MVVESKISEGVALLAAFQTLYGASVDGTALTYIQVEDCWRQYFSIFADAMQ